MKQIALPIPVLLVLIALAVNVTMPSTTVEANHYQRFRDGKSLDRLLSSSIETGDSREVVEELIGPGEPVVEDVEKHRIMLKETAQWHPELYPQGVMDSRNE